MRIQYASDLHIEQHPKATFEETIIPEADYLVLCGDICIFPNVETPNHPNFQRFLEYVSERWKLVFYVPGLSEMKVPFNVFKNMCSSYKNIKILHMNHYLLENKLLIVGLPLMIRKHGKMFDENRDYLEHTIKHSPYPILVCSYFSPFTWMYDEHRVYSPKETIAEPDLEKLITKPVMAWIVGHIHQSIEYTRRYFLPTGEDGSVLFVSNPRGDYVNEKQSENPYFRNESVIYLKLEEESDSHTTSEIPLWHRRNLVLGRKQ